MSKSRLEIEQEIHAVLERFGVAKHDSSDGLVGADFGLCGSDSAEFFRELEERFNVNFVDETCYEKEYTRRFLGLRIGSYRLKHMPDLSVSQLVEIINSRSEEGSS